MWAPDTASYGYDSRAASIRILSAPGVPLPATRFEVRVPGADVSLVVFFYHAQYITSCSFLQIFLSGKRLLPNTCQSEVEEDILRSAQYVRRRNHRVSSYSCCLPETSPSLKAYLRIPHHRFAASTPALFGCSLASLADSQMNPHYAFSAIFALGLRGIAEKSKLPYGPIGSPGVTRDTLIKLPTSLESATAQFKRPESLAREVMGDYFVDHFAGTREHELEVFRKAVTDWEGGFFFLFVFFLASRLTCREGLVRPDPM